MKYLLTLLFLFSWILIQAQEDYRIMINDTSFEIQMGKEYSFKTNGQEINFKLELKDTLLYNDDFYSFKYSKDFKINKMQVDEGIEQIMLMTAEGSGILIQKYSRVNPTTLNEMMISEVTKESLNYGYEMTRKDYQRVLKSGHTVDVDKAILTYKDATNIYEIASIGNKDEGILIMTMLMDVTHIQGKKIIDLMWNTLFYK